MKIESRLEKMNLPYPKLSNVKLLIKIIFFFSPKLAGYYVEAQN